VATVAPSGYLGWLLARRVFRGQLLVRGLVTLPMVLPPVVAGVALLAAFGRRAAGSWLAPRAGAAVHDGGRSWRGPAAAPLSSDREAGIRGLDRAGRRRGPAHRGE
jgi:ABC-type Fe3+ transport system permease subunit